jgi:hypothetical protein
LRLFHRGSPSFQFDGQLKQPTLCFVTGKTMGMLTGTPCRLPQFGGRRTKIGRSTSWHVRPPHISRSLRGTERWSVLNGLKSQHEIKRAAFTRMNADFIRLRAQAVADGLVANGVEASRIQSREVGPVKFQSKPTESRRLEITVGNPRRMIRPGGVTVAVAGAGRVEMLTGIDGGHPGRCGGSC